MGLTDKIKIYADGADLETALRMIEQYNVKGFTTNPTLMHKKGIKDYQKFAKEFIAVVRDYPISFEVFEDDFEEMRRQARLINSWGDNVYVKIPIMNTEERSTAGLIAELNKEEIKINTTAVFTEDKIDGLENVFDSGTPGIISIFAGRIADAGHDPKEKIKYALNKFRSKPHVEILWASTREPYNIIEAINCRCHIITVPNNIIEKIPTFGKDLYAFSLETVNMFREDALKSGYAL